MSAPTVSIIKLMDKIPETTPIGTEVARIEVQQDGVDVALDLGMYQYRMSDEGAFIGDWISEGNYFKLSGDTIITNTNFDYEFSWYFYYDLFIQVPGSDPTLTDPGIRFFVSDVMETLKGTSHDDVLRGGLGADKIIGGAGNDKLNGLYADDILYGGLGKDTLAGGSGEDTFLYKSTRESMVGQSDTILRWDHTGKNKPMDVIDLSAIDANTKVSGNQDFSWLGTKEFTGHAGELRYERGATATMIYADTNGDREADMAIRIAHAVKLYGGDFLL